MPEIKRRQSLAELADWTEHLWALGDRAEKLAAAPAARVSLDARVELAKEAFRLLWLSLSPAVVAASCKTSALMGEPLLSAVPLVEEQMMVLHRLRKAGVLSQPDEFGGEAEADQPAEPEPEPEFVNAAHERHLEDVDDAEPEPAEVAEPEAAEPAEVDEPQGIKAQPTEQWVTGAELCKLLGMSLGGLRCWNAKGWLKLGEHFRKDPGNGRRYLYNPEACRLAVASRSRRLRGQAARTEAGAEERRLLRVERQNARRERARQGKAVQVEGEVERDTEPVMQEPEHHPEPVMQEQEPAVGGRLEQLLSALLMEVRGSGG